MTAETVASARRAQRHTAQVLAALLGGLPEGVLVPSWTIYRTLPGELSGLVEDRADLAVWGLVLRAPIVEERGHDGILRGRVTAVRDGVTVEVWAELDRPGGAR